MTWILVLYIYAGVMSKGDSVTVSSIDGFTSAASCATAGATAKTLVSNSFKDARFVCLKND